MNTEKVIKGLRAHIGERCTDCPFKIHKYFCSLTLQQEALDVIQKQQEQIQKLKADNLLFYQENKQLKQDNKIFNEFKDSLCYKIAKVITENQEDLNEPS